MSRTLSTNCGSGESSKELGLDPEADAIELDERTRQLREELLQLDVEDVTRPAVGSPPEGAKAIEAAALGTLLVTAGGEVLGAVVRLISGWMSRGSSRTVKLQLGDDAIELTDVSAEERQRLVRLSRAEREVEARAV